MTVAAGVREWAAGQGPTNLLLHGEPGVGKSHLACALLRSRLERGETGIFRDVPDLLLTIRATYRRKDAEGPSEDDILAALRDVDLLVLDDLGAERQTDWAAETLFALINGRYNAERAMLVTTNYGPEALAAHVGERVAGRLLESSLVVALSGRNWRA